VALEIYEEGIEKALKLKQLRR